MLYSVPAAPLPATAASPFSGSYRLSPRRRSPFSTSSSLVQQGSSRLLFGFGVLACVLGFLSREGDAAATLETKRNKDGGGGALGEDAAKLGAETIWRKLSRPEKEEMVEVIDREMDLQLGGLRNVRDAVKASRTAVDEALAAETASQALLKNVEELTEGVAAAVLTTTEPPTAPPAQSIPTTTPVPPPVAGAGNASCAPCTFPPTTQAPPTSPPPTISPAFFADVSALLAKVRNLGKTAATEKQTSEQVSEKVKSLRGLVDKQIIATTQAKKKFVAGELADADTELKDRLAGLRDRLTDMQAAAAGGKLLTVTPTYVDSLSKQVKTWKRDRDKLIKKLKTYQKLQRENAGKV